jgi:hypothetical protein
MDNLKTYLPPLGGLLMSSVCIWDGIRQLRSPSVSALYFASIHVPLPNVAIWISVIIHQRALDLEPGLRAAGPVGRVETFGDDAL